MGGHRIHVLLRLLEGDARLQAAHHQEPVEVVVDLFRLEDQGNGELPFPSIEDAGALHADDGVGIAIHAQGGADDLWIGAQLEPQLVGEDHDMFMAGLSFFGQEVAAQEQRLAQHLQHAVRGQARLDVLRLVFGGEVEAGAVKALRSEKTVFCCFQSVKSPAATPLRLPWIFDQTITS